MTSSEMRAPETAVLATPTLATPIILFGAVCWYYTVSFWSDVPYYDEWRNIPFVSQITTGHFSPLSLLASDQGHTVFWFRVATWIETKFLSYDPRFSIFLGIFFLTGSAVILARHYRTHSGYLSFGFLISSCALIFSLGNWENLLAAWLVNSAATMFFMLLSLTTIGGNGRSYVIGLIAATFCSLSFTNGLLIWPCATLVLWTSGNKRGIGPIVILALVFGARFWMEKGHLGSSLNLASTISRFLATLGLPLTLDSATISATATEEAQVTSIASGIIVFCFSVIMLAKVSRRPTKRAWMSYSILLFGLGSCGMIAMGRSDLVVSQALSSRYFTTAAIVYIGLFMLILELPNIKFGEVAGSTVAAFAIVASLSAMHSEFRTGPYRKQTFDTWRTALLNYKAGQVTDPLFKPQQIRAYAAELDRLKLGPFRGQH